MGIKIRSFLMRLISHSLEGWGYLNKAYLRRLGRGAFLYRNSINGFDIQQILS